MKSIPNDVLRGLRNDVDIDRVVEQLGIPTRSRGSRTTLRCPDCGRDRARLYPQGNLVRCFRCKRSFNPIDLVMAERNCSFLDAARYLLDTVALETRRRSH